MNIYSIKSKTIHCYFKDMSEDNEHVLITVKLKEASIYSERHIDEAVEILNQIPTSTFEWEKELVIENAELKILS